VEDPAAMLQKVTERAWEIKKELTARVRHQLRSMPQLQFFIDDTLDYVYKMEEIFKTIVITPEEKENSK
jgi:ribosome-binding factor A